MKDTPVYRDAFALCGVLMQEFGSVEPYLALRRRLVDHACSLLESIVLALEGRRRQERLRDADEALRLVRAYLALAYELKILPLHSYLAYMQHLDGIGRQIGGWLKKEIGV